MKQPSCIVKEFGPSGLDTPRFVAKHLPKRWKPEIILHGIWDGDISHGVSHGHNTRIIRLRNFPTKILSLSAGPDEKTWAPIKVQFKKVRDDIFRWLYRLEDSGKVSLSNGMSVGLGIGQFWSEYKTKEFWGTFSATFIGMGPRTTMLVAQLYEGCIAAKAPRNKLAPPNYGWTRRAPFKESFSARGSSRR